MKLEELKDKLLWEGGLSEGIDYFGRELLSDDKKLNTKWRKFYDLHEEITQYLELEETPE